MTDKVKQASETLVDSDKEAEHSFAFEINNYAGESATKKPNALLMDCGASTHIINDESKFSKFDDKFAPEKQYIELADGTQSKNVALKRGDVEMTIMDTTGKLVNATLKNTLYITTYPQNIFSVQAATERGTSVSFNPDSAELVYKDGTKFNIDKHGRLYYLSTFNKNDSDSVNYTCDQKGWHEILGHCNYEDILKLKDVVEGLKISNSSSSKPQDCNVCIEGKMTQSRNRNPDSRASAPLELIYTDLAGPIDPVSREGFRYSIAFTDDYSGAIFVYFLKSKSDTVAATQKFLADTAPYGEVKCIRSDNGGEFIFQKFESPLEKNKIKHEMSAPYSPHQIGTAERHWRTLFEMGRCLLLHSNLHKEFWPYAVMTATYIRNRCFNNRLKQIPHFAITGRKPNLSNMRVFGSECSAYKQNKQKLDPRCTKGISLGYDNGSPAYLVYIPETGKVMKYRVVKFPTTRKGVEQQTQTVRPLPDDDDDLMPSPHSISDVDRSVQPQGESETSPTCQPPDKGLRCSTRTTRPPAYPSDYVTDMEDDDQVLTNADYCYKSSAFPQTYQEAMDSPESSNWKAAMEEEMNSLTENNTFTFSDLPEGKNAVGGRWVFTMKETSTGAKTFKARYVAKGYSQVSGIDFQETFAPTANLTSLRVLMQMAAQHDLVLHQMDVKTAYLNAPIDCEIYMDQAEGFEVPSESGGRLVYKLNKSLYGLKQSGRNWNHVLHCFLLENSFVQSPVDNCVYTKHVKSGFVPMLVWVDDIIIAASNMLLMSKAKGMLKERFHMKDLGRLSYFLGLHFEQGDGFVKMNQTGYITKVLERFELTNCKPRSTPSELKLKFDGETPVDPRRYREAVGSLVYAMKCTRPDICWVVTKLSQFRVAPMKGHWIALKHVLRYLKGTLDFGLCYRKCDDGVTLIGYSDADWASSTDDRRSISGYCFSLNRAGPLISWKSRKQPTVALSSCEAEYIALAAAVQQGMYLTQMIKDIGEVSGPVLIFGDNQGTIALSKNPVNQQRSKHIDVRCHFIRSVQNAGKTVIKYCPTADMVADVLTKPVTKFKLEKFRSYIFGSKDISVQVICKRNFILLLLYPFKR